MADYNGWTNYETWCINLWLSNDQGLDEMTRELVAEAVSEDESHPRYAVAHALKDMVEELPECADVLGQASFVSDLLGAALSEVDWYELADAWMSDIKETV